MEKYIYLIQIFDVLHKMSIIIFSVTLIVATIAGIGAATQKVGFGEEDEDYLFWKALCRCSGIICIVSAVLMVFTPSKETCFEMMAFHYGEEIATNEKVEDVTEKTLDLLSTWIDSKKEEIELKEER